MDKNLDKDTLAIQAEQTKLKGLTENAGWQIVKMRLIKRVANLLSLNNPEIMNTPSDMLLQVITAKKTAADELMSWLREIEGDVAQGESNQILIQKTTEGLIYNEDEK